MEELEYICFEIIAASGNARSYYIEAIQFAKNKQFAQAEEYIQQADEEYNQAHRIHMGLLQEEAMNKKNYSSLLLVHSLDQMMSAEIFGILAREFLYLYKKIMD